MSVVFEHLVVVVGGFEQSSGTKYFSFSPDVDVGEKFVYFRHVTRLESDGGICREYAFERNVDGKEILVLVVPNGAYQLSQIEVPKAQEVDW